MSDSKISPENSVREVVAVFHDAEQLEAAANQLVNAGVPERRLSILADKKTVEKRLGHHFEPVEIMEDDPRVPQRAFVANADRQAAAAVAIGLPLYVGAMGGAAMVVASGSALAMILLAAATGGAVGGRLGAVIAEAIGQTHAEKLEDELLAGGILLWVFVTNDSEEKLVSEMLKSAGGKDVHAHEIKRFRAGGEIPFEDWIKDWNPDPFLF